MQCRDATTGTTCTAASGDENCLRCDGVRASSAGGTSPCSAPSGGTRQFRLFIVDLVRHACLAVQVWCVECKNGFYFDENFVCQPGRFTTHCQQMSKNPNCASCNPDVRA